MVINIHAGHNPDGKVACGAVGLIKESTENRNVKTKLINILRSAGHTVYDCTVDNGTSQNDVLQKIVEKCNSHTVDLDISIHFNAGRGDFAGDGKTAGAEVHIYDTKGSSYEFAKRICEKISALGFANRGVKVNPSLYVLSHTKAQALLVECCFVDDADDVKLYNADSMARAIAEGILGDLVSRPESQDATVKAETKDTYTGSSIVEYLNSIGVDSSFDNRKKLAVQYGISNYSGTAEQNLSLLDKMRNGFAPTQSSTSTSNAKTNYYKAFDSISIVDGLKSIGVDSSMTNRKKIAETNGISNYFGTAEQNTKLLVLAKNGKLIKA